MPAYSGQRINSENPTVNTKSVSKSVSLSVCPREVKFVRFFAYYQNIYTLSSKQLLIDYLID